MLIVLVMLRTIDRYTTELLALVTLRTTDSYSVIAPTLIALRTKDRTVTFKHKRLYVGHLGTAD